MPADPAPHLSRRVVLLGGASLVFLGACGDDSKDRSSGSGKTRPTASDGSKFSLVTFFGNDAVQAGLPQRVTFGLGDAQGALIADGPARLDLTLEKDNATVGRSRVSLHRQGLSRGYYPLTFTPATAGYYTVSTTVEGDKVDATFSVSPKVAMPQVGQRMVVADTPTTTDRRGVDPICTRQPACPFHGVNLRDALAAGRPVALMIATPAFCQQAICGPVLDLLVGLQAEFAGRIEMVHAEVYANGAQAANDINKATLAPAVQAFQLPFEPVFFLSRADGTVATRLDTIFDRAELRSALQSVVA